MEKKVEKLTYGLTDRDFLVHQVVQNIEVRRGAEVIDVAYEQVRLARADQLDEEARVGHRLCPSSVIHGLVSV